ncbi:AMP-binding protein [uncultured Shewanella sp.]|uniref:AMP-binding protein n=1 Tax=uncultured Shewanella sp. TaxID=173975 RepID=UPI002601C7F4|nr:AMP-binding protein [uncultured Shewanella sp.]
MASNAGIEQKLKVFAQCQSDAIAIKHINGIGVECDSITYLELYQRSVSMAYHLFKCQQEIKNKSVLILLQPCIDFSIAYFACLFSGLHGIPVKSPDFMSAEKSCAFIRYVIEHSQTEMILVDDETLSLLKMDKVLVDLLDKCVVINSQHIEIINEDERHSLVLPDFDNERINYLQYTSGSTANAKAVVVRNKQLLFSLQNNMAAWNYSSSSITVNWAPHSHVYGLVCGLLLPLYSGGTIILIDPNDVVMNPELWLQTLSYYKGTHSGCPNFGYELCNNRLNKKEVSQYDLSHWHYAINGGEMVKLKTMKDFTELLSDSGFQLRSFCPAYGMSEMAGLISTQKPSQNPSCFYADKYALTENKVFALDADAPNSTAIVGSGMPVDGLDLVIVDPIRKDNCAEGIVGEVWLHSLSYCDEYLFVDPKKNNSRNIFNNRVYFATGDMGFIDQDQLFLTGRLKELIIINGKNYYPHDIENVIKNISPDMEALTCVAFTVESHGNLGLCIVQETNEYEVSYFVEHKKAIRARVYQEFQLNVLEFVFVSQGQIPRTASGKLQRGRAAKLYLKNEFIQFSQSVS